MIYHVETFDVTTIRASTPMFLMSRKIKALGVKMVLSGEGADEVFGGYLYFHKAPNKVRALGADGAVGGGWRPLLVVGSAAELMLSRHCKLLDAQGFELSVKVVPLGEDTQ